MKLLFPTKHLMNKTVKLFIFKWFVLGFFYHIFTYGYGNIYLYLWSNLMWMTRGISFCSHYSLTGYFHNTPWETPMNRRLPIAISQRQKLVHLLFCSLKSHTQTKPTSKYKKFSLPALTQAYIISLNVWTPKESATD